MYEANRTTSTNMKMLKDASKDARKQGEFLNQQFHNQSHQIIIATQIIVLKWVSRYQTSSDNCYVFNKHFAMENKYQECNLCSLETAGVAPGETSNWPPNTNTEGKETREQRQATPTW